MTLQEISQLYYLNREIEMDRERLERLRSSMASPAASRLTGMPRVGHNHSNGLDVRIAEIVDLEAVIADKVARCIQERNRLERYIAGIPDSLTRQVFTLRFVDGLSWEQVADRIGGNNTSIGLRVRCHRYLKREKKM